MNKKIQEQDYDIEILDVALLKPYANNPRQTNQSAIDKVAKSIQQNQFSSVIVVDKNYEIIAGHTRHAAATQLGLKTLPVFIAKNLDDEQVKRLRLLDNKLNELTEWDVEKLIQELEPSKLDEDFQKLFEPLIAQDLSEFDLSDDSYVPDEEGERFANSIIQYVMIFDSEDQQNIWYSFLQRLKEDFPKHETHASRIAEYIKKLNIPIN
mgnify:CR=1 FL=1